MRNISAQRHYTIVAVWLTAVNLLIWWYFFASWNMLILYICAINVTTLLLYAWDKAISGMHNNRFTRVPELVLHSLALLGGSPIAFIAQKVFRHKTLKASFRRSQRIVVMLQILLIILYLYIT